MKGLRIRGWLVILALFGSSVLESSCQGTKSQIQFTAEEAVFNTIPKNAQQFRLLTQGKAPNGNIVIVYEYYLPWSGKPLSRKYVLGYGEVDLKGSGWEIVGTDYREMDLFIDVPIPIDYDVYQDTYTALYGPRPSNPIRSVGMTLSNGEIVRGEITGSGFILFSEDILDVCEIIFYGADGKLLDKKTLDRQYWLTSECY